MHIMNISINWIVACLGFISVISTAFLGFKRYDSYRLPLYLYLGTYLITIFIGSLFLGLNFSFAWQVLQEYGIDINAFNHEFDWQYWALLFSPILIPIWCILLSELLPAFSSVFFSIPEKFEFNINYKTYIIVLCLLSVYCAIWLYQFYAIYYQPLTHTTLLISYYDNLIQLRSHIFMFLPGKFFGLIYMGFPALSYLSLYQANKSRAIKWLFGFIITTLLGCAFILLTFQKYPAFVFLLILMIGLVDLKIVRTKMLILAPILLVILLSIYQYYLLSGWRFIDGFNLITFRMASSFPFYVKVFPHILPYQGIDYCLNFIGIGHRPMDNLIIFKIMYPELKNFVGSAAAPAHLIAYSQGGPIYSYITIFIIGLGLIIVSKLMQHNKGPVSFSMAMLGMMALYYINSMSLRGILFTSYGLFWGLVPIILIRIISLLILLF